ncbi:unnamed protein product [Linum tenue]|uniref:non-specific serine/threonine protein kinase n=1 Tax=Linum tenue TaxID=586396 RepID=A0AAV0QPH6_9ROSI|nr:unnamed protein product [Linum tenue]
MELLPLLQQFVLLFLLLCCSFSSVFPRSHELGILLEVKESLIAGGESLSDWNRSNPNFCKWSGVTCRSGRVVSGLNLSDSSLTGSIPPALGRLQNLLHLDLSSNALTGPIPTTLANLSVLESLLLFTNDLTGRIPAQLGSIKTLRVVKIGNNWLAGEIPASLGNLPNLVTLGLASCTLTGPIPPQLGRLGKLDQLVLQDNQLYGPIPPELGNCSSLTVLALSNNKLNGTIPPELGRLQNLQYLNLLNNSLTGHIPPALGNLSKQLELRMSHNSFSGEIPAELGRLQQLQIILDLSYNNLTGSIPPSIGKLSTLEALDLSHNQLQGRVPPQVGEIRSLGYFNVSFNRLEGDLGDRFQRWKADSFLGNSKLCGGPLDQCRRSANKHSSLSEAAIVVLSAITTLAALALLGLGLTFFCKRRREYLRARSDVSCIYSSSKSSHAHRRPLFLNPGSMKREFRWDDIMEATNHLGDEFVIGSGGSGTIYRAELRNGDTVAVKKVPWKDELMFNKSFAREVKTLGRIRHRHLVKLMGYCCNRGAGFNLLIYDYMENGSLWDWLHRQPGVNNKRKQCLDWEVRMQIALGLVRGVEYLHHDCVPIILHRDIKSSNVLLDSDMEAHLGDFGLAKSVVEFYDTTSTTESNSLFAGSYGYIAPGSLTLLSSLFPNFWVFFQLSV